MELAAVVNKGAPDMLLVACVTAVAGGSGCRSSSRGWRSGGADLEVDFVPILRRRGDAHSGVGVEIRALYRSDATSARGVRMLAAGFVSLPLRRVEAPDLELGVNHGALPRPICHSDTWLVSGEFFVRSSKLLVSEGVVPSLGSRCVVVSSSGGCFGGGGNGRRATACCAEELLDCFIIFLFSRVLCVNVWEQLAFQALLVYACVFCTTFSI